MSGVVVTVYVWAVSADDKRLGIQYLGARFTIKPNKVEMSVSDRGAIKSRLAAYYWQKKEQVMTALQKEKRKKKKES